MSNDIFSTLRVYLSKLTEGEHTPAEVLASVNAWLRESGEAIKSKIEEEVERTVAKRGFVKQADFDKLKRDVEELRSGVKVAKKPAVKPTSAKKSPAKKVATAKTRVVKKAAPQRVKKAVKN